MSILVSGWTLSAEFIAEMNRYYDDEARRYGSHRARLVCRFRGHRWFPRGPFIRDFDGGAPILYSQCHRCYQWCGPAAVVEQLKDIYTRAAG